MKNKCKRCDLKKHLNIELKMDWNFVQQLVLCVHGFIIIGNALNDQNAHKPKTYDEKTSLLRECSVERSLEKVSADFTF